MKFWKYGRVVVALIGAIVLGLSITCCGVYTSGYMYVTGVQFNQIAAYKIDHDFGYLTPVTGQPFASSGSDPVQETILAGGRFLAVVNKGSDSVSIYSIGGAGVLFFQASYSTSGSNPIAMTVNSGGNFLYVVDQNAPADVVNGVDLNAGRGDVDVYSINATTGQLTLITNANTFNTSGSQLPYFPVNFKPVQVITAAATATSATTGTTTTTGTTATTGTTTTTAASAGTFLYVLDQAYTIVPGGAAANPTVPAGCFSSPATTLACQVPDIFLYAINSTTGQLTLTQNSALSPGQGIGPGTLSTIYTSGKYVYIANTAITSQFPAGSILPFTVGPTGVLQTLVGGTVGLPTGAGATFPDAILANSTTQFLYVANFGPSSNPNLSNSNIAPFTIDPTNGQLTPIPVTPGGIYPTGSGPVWIAEDSTNQYLYTANFNDNTITAKVLDATHGQLSNIIKGTVQTTTIGQPNYIVVSGRTF